MSDTTTPTKTRRPASERQIAANRANSTKSTGAKTEIGRMHSSMNNCHHGLYSTKDLLPSECPIERQKLIDDITAAAKPVDGVQRLLTERIIKTAWRVRRGERAQDARATKSVNAIVEGAATEEARRAETLGAELDENEDALYELRTFPAGVTYLLDQCSIILEDLSQGLPLLASQRRRCFSLIGKKREHVLRSDRVATPLFLALAGLMYGQEATVENVLALLGTDPPEWMQDAEFVVRAQRLRSAVPTQAAARETLKDSISKVMEGLKGELESVREVADRDRELDAAEACADATPVGTKLTDAIDKIDRSCLAAIRRLEARQRPERPGPKRDPKQSAATGEALHDLVESGQAEPAAVAADAQDTVAAEVPTEDPAPVAATTTEAGAPEIGGEADGASSGEPEPEKCEDEANSGPAPTDPGPDKCEDEANCVYGIKEPDFGRFGPEAERLRKLYHHLQAIDRPQPVVAEESANLFPLTKGGYRGVHERCHPEDPGLEFTPPTPPS